MDSNAVKKMTTLERLQAMEALWDALLHDDAAIASPGWHRDVLENRKAQIVRGEATFLSLRQVKEREST